MNVNSSRYHLLLGEPNWARCATQATAIPVTLGSAWAASITPPDLEYDSGDQTLHLREVLDQWAAAPADKPVTLDQRRPAAADRSGNLYQVGDDRSTLQVRSAGSGLLSVFQTAVPAVSDTGEAFQDIATPAASVSREFCALAVTEDHYLVAAWTEPTRAGLQVMDLTAGGPGLDLVWPLPDFAPFDMSARCGGGVWILDRAHQKLWELDARLNVVSSGQASVLIQPAMVDDFQPEHTGSAPRTQPARSLPGGIDLSSSGLGASPADAPRDLVAVESIADNTVLLLDVDVVQGSSRVLCYSRNADDSGVKLQASAWLYWHDDGTVAESPERPFLAQDLVFAKAGPASSAAMLLIATQEGNQAVAYAIDTPSPLTITRQPRFLPMRRWGGRALVALRGRAWYDSSAQWVPLVPQQRARYVEQAEFVTPCFDSGTVGCVWDRLLLDAAIASGTSVQIWSRASDETATLSSGWVEVPATWQVEPAPYLRGAGSELPWLRAELALPLRADRGSGAWELLFQQARGRYLQLRIQLTGNGRATPRVRALRAWFPRFSYARRFLPPVWSEEPSSASFIDRFLGNFEGTLSGIEDRMASLQHLLDPRCAPAQALPWLASWFEVALDPAWDEYRQRLFIRHAYDFFSYRGTIHGLRMALSLAFDACIDESTLGPPTDGCSSDADSIRIIETYLTRTLDPAMIGDPSAASGVVSVDPSQRWSPGEGNSGLVTRYAQFRGTVATPSQLSQAFDLTSPADAASATQWATFCSLALGFVPAMGAAERARWRAFVQARHASVAELLNPAWSSFDDVRVPADQPGGVLADDWSAYLAATASPSISIDRQRWQDFLARRYRRVARLNTAWDTGWTSFDAIAVPDILPPTFEAQTDWLQFEGEATAMQRNAHRFSVLLPTRSIDDEVDAQDRLRLAQRIVALEKPAHTVFDVRFYWAMFRIGEARLGLDTLLDQGSRAPQLIADAVLGRAYIGASFVGGPPPLRDADRLRLDC